MDHPVRYSVIFPKFTQSRRDTTGENLQKFTHLTSPLGYVPEVACWVHRIGDALPKLAVAEADSTKIHIYDGRSEKMMINMNIMINKR